MSRFDKKEADLLTQLSRLEIEREEETSTLFRAASLTTTLMDGYMKSVCGDFLHTALFPTIHRWEMFRKIPRIQSNSQGHWSFTCAGSWRQSKAVSSIRARLKVQQKRVPMQSSCFRLITSITLSRGLTWWWWLCRCWMTLQNLSSCRARRVPAHCATFVLACRGTSRTGAEISLDFGFEHYRFKFLLEHYRSGGRKRDLWKLGLSPDLYSFAFSVLQFSILDRYVNAIIYTTGSFPLTLGIKKEAIVRC